MITRKERTIETYKRAGALMRLFKELGGEALMETSKVLKSSDSDKFWKALNAIDVICIRAEDNMFRDYPDLSDEYLDVFSGPVCAKPRNAVDEEIIALAKDAANGLFK